MSSVGFDWIADRTCLIYFLVSLAFADQADLDFDPTIERVIEDEKIRYKILCAGKWYRVLEPLSDFKAARPLSRATRVWKVQELKDKYIDSSVIGRVLVIKDVRMEKKCSL
ncbi:hypothetical protein QCA50_016769 [Cerrena zonata]|uniref:Fungal-type protein kinase domain-containing protein n=1 Tax=Cerrena zonata TaxID=2478898 RepID=A0AAW0FU70_9APHY